MSRTKDHLYYLTEQERYNIMADYLTDIWDLPDNETYWEIEQDIIAEYIEEQDEIAEVLADIYGHHR